MDDGLADLATVAEHVVKHSLHDLYILEGSPSAAIGKTPGDWVATLRQCEVLPVSSTVKTRGAATMAGMFLSGKVGRPVTISTGQGDMSAVLRFNEGNGHKRLYYFILSPARTVAAASATSELPEPGDAVPPIAGGPAAANSSTPQIAGCGNGLDWGPDE
jgi:hypothetical protein